MLHAIVRREHGVAETGMILEEVWPGDRSDLESRVARLAKHVSDVRRKLSPQAGGLNYLENASGLGYFVSVPVKTIPLERGGPAVPAPGLAPVQRPFFLRERLLWAAGVVILALAGWTGYLRVRGEGLQVTGYRPLTNDGRVKIGPLVTDGQRVFFRERIGDDWKVVSVPVAGGEVSILDLTLQTSELFDIAADGSELLLLTRDGGSARLVSWPLSGGVPREIPLNGGSAGWSPDRQLIALGDGMSLTVAKPDGERISSAVSRFARVHSPRWSRDGARISFTLEDPNNEATSLWQADREGRHWERMPQTERSGGNQAHGIWTADGRYFVYEAGSTERHDLWAIPGSNRSLAGYFGKPARLTNGPLNWTWPVPLKGTGRMLAMGDSTRGELVRLDSRTGVWNPYLGGAAAYEVDFSRDRKWIAYTRYPDHTIWKAKADGSERVLLTPPEIEAHQPHWSSEGRRIAFMGRNPGRPWRVFTLEAETRSLNEPIPHGEDQGVPTWSSDGHSLMFGERLYAKDQKAMMIRVFDEKSGQLTVVPGSANMWTPRWSPDGTYVSALRPDGTALLLSTCCSGNWETILDGVNDLDDSMWSYDSKYIFLLARSGPGRRQLIRIQIPDGRIERLTDVTTFPLTNEQWFGLAPDGSVLGLRGARLQEIYALDYAVR